MAAGDDLANQTATWLGALAIVGAFFAWLWSVASQQAVLKLKVETLWAFLFRRGVIEGLQKGWITENSPVELVQAAIKAMEPVAPKLKEWYEKEGKVLADIDLIFHIEDKFGEVLMNEVCKPHLLSNGICLVAAALVCGRKLQSTPSLSV